MKNNFLVLVILVIVIAMPHITFAQVSLPRKVSYLSIDPTSRSHAWNDSVHDHFQILVETDSSWSGDPSEYWIRPHTGWGGNGTGIISYYLYPNSNGPPRTGYISVDAGYFNEVYTITQDGDPDYLEISPSNRSHSNSAGSGFGITVSTCWPWTAAAIPEWITIVGGATGDGNGSVNYAISENTGYFRSGQIRIQTIDRTRNFTVNQSGIFVTPTPTPTLTPVIIRTPSPTPSLVPTSTPYGFKTPMPTPTPSLTPIPTPTKTPVYNLTQRSFFQSKPGLCSWYFNVFEDIYPEEIAVENLTDSNFSFTEDGSIDPETAPYLRKPKFTTVLALDYSASMYTAGAIEPLEEAVTRAYYGSTGDIPVTR